MRTPRLRYGYFQIFKMAAAAILDLQNFKFLMIGMFKRFGAILTPNELVLTFGGLHVCVQFGENRRRNANVRVSTDGHTHTHTHGQMQNDFIICPMLYAIAVGQIINSKLNDSCLLMLLLMLVPCVMMTM